MKKIILTLLVLSTYIIGFSLDYKIVKSETGQEISFNQLIQEIKLNDVVFFGELHDDSLLHQIKSEMFQQLTKVDTNFVLGLESFAKNDQVALNSYLNGDFSYEQLDANSNLWSNYQEAYSEVVDYAKDNNIKVLATNTPIYISGLVAREGYMALNKLSEKERTYYAREFKSFENDYRRMFLEEMKKLTKGSSSQVNSLILERLYQAQSLKDDTMAETIFDYLEDNHHAKVFHINGSFHSDNHYGVFQKLELLNPNLKISSISPVYLPSGEALEWDYTMFGLSEYIIMYHRDQESSVVNDKADKSEFLSIDKHTISFIFEPSAQVLTVNDKITFNQTINNDKLLISKDIKDLKIYKGKESVDFNQIDYNDKFNQIEVKASAKDLDFVYIYKYQVNQERPFHFNLQEYMWHPIVSLGEKSNFEVNALGPNKMKFIAPAEVTITPMKKDAIYYSWKSFDKEYGFSIIGDIYFTKSVETDDILITLYSFQEDYYLLEDYAYFIEQYFHNYKLYFGDFGYDSFSIIQSVDHNYKSFDNMLLVNKEVFNTQDIFISPGVLGHDLARVWIDSKCNWSHQGANWQEILANFVANYLWLELNKPEEASLWRKAALEDISAMPRDEIKSLEEFSFPNNKFSAVNGYKIGGMLFYYIYNKVGKNDFFAVIGDILNNNKMLSGEEFFDLLQDKTGVKEFSKLMEEIYPVRVFIQEASVKDATTKVKIISSRGDESDFDLDIKITNKDQFVQTSYHIDKKETILEFGIEATEIAIDPDYKLYRYLDNSENIFNLKRTFLEKPLLIVPQDSEQFPDIYNVGNRLRSNGVAIDMMPLSSLNEFSWKEKSIIYIGKHTNNSLVSTLQPYLPPSFILGNNKFTYEGVVYDQENYSLIINTKNPFATNKSLSMWLWNSDKKISNIQAIFNYTAPSWVILEDNGIGFTEIAKGNLVDENLFPTRVKIERGN